MKRVRSGLALSLSLLLSAGSLMDCRKSRADTAELRSNQDSVEQSYASLERQLRQLETKFSSLRRELEALPPDLPGLGEARGQLFAAEEVIGVTGAKLTWLASQIDPALHGKQLEPLRRVSKEIAQTAKEMQQVDRAGLELTHQLFSFERTAALWPKTIDGGSTSAPRAP